MTHYFEVTLTNFKGHNLLACDRSGTSDPYLIINFDGTQKFKSKVIKKTLNPTWKNFSVRLSYETRMYDRMVSKYLTVNVYDRDRFGSDDPMGMMKIDLWSLATGPTHIDHLLREKGKGAGRLEFDVVMDNICEVDLSLSNVSVLNVFGKNQNGTSDVYLEYYFAEEYSLPEEVMKTTVIRGTNNPVWKARLPNLIFKTTLKNLLNGTVKILLKHQVQKSEDLVIGEADLSFRELCQKIEKNMKILVELKFFDAGNSTGTLKCDAELANVPIFSQLLGGKYTENGVNGGSLLFPNLFAPKDFPEKGQGGPPKLNPKSRLKIFALDNRQKVHINLQKVAMKGFLNQVKTGQTKHLPLKNKIQSSPQLRNPKLSSISNKMMSLSLQNLEIMPKVNSTNQSINQNQLQQIKQTKQNLSNQNINQNQTQQIQTQQIQQQQTQQQQIQQIQQQQQQQNLTNQNINQNQTQQIQTQQIQQQQKQQKQQIQQPPTQSIQQIQQNLTNQNINQNQTQQIQQQQKQQIQQQQQQQIQQPPTQNIQQIQQNLTNQNINQNQTQPIQTQQTQQQQKKQIQTQQIQQPPTQNIQQTQQNLTNQNINQNYGINQGMKMNQNQGMNQGMNMNQNYGMNRGMNMNQNQGINRGMNMNQNRGMNQGMNYSSMPNMRSIGGMNQNYGMNQGMKMNQNQGMNQGMNMNQNYGMNRGMNMNQNQGINRGMNMNQKINQRTHNYSSMPNMRSIASRGNMNQNYGMNQGMKMNQNQGMNQRMNMNNQPQVTLNTVLQTFVQNKGMQKVVNPNIQNNNIYQTLNRGNGGNNFNGGMSGMRSSNTAINSFKNLSLMNRMSPQVNKTSQIYEKYQQLPTGWEKCFTNDGRVYYKDHKTKTTHWNLPRNF
ncbi:tricalbin-1-related [Anaeramoeba flamelloides]|uniref:Tricalbin-1-related n=1 Tax=Anaeramoeba flamelloides TaxID=1746091 RepID=A0AAV7YWY1_9EUKA|nr:tricalbin-1-related [Anaeramoeba flamelloides]